MMRWCIEALAFHRKTLHARFRPTAGNMLREVPMHAQVHLLPAPPSREEMLASLTEELLDALEGCVIAPKPEGKRRARAKTAAKRRRRSTDAGIFVCLTVCLGLRVSNSRMVLSRGAVWLLCLRVLKAQSQIR